jgi:uncharacterized protein
MTELVADKAIERMREHLIATGAKAANLIFHGGEPLLADKDFLRYTVTRARSVVPGDIELRFATQTNGTRLDEAWADFLLEHKINVGVSVDGDKEANDRFRLTHGRESSFVKTRRALELLSNSKYDSIRGGLLTVMHPLNPPIHTFKSLAAWGTSQIDFLFPHHSYVDPPPFTFDPDSGFGFGKWLVEIFDEWFWNDLADVKVRIFEDIMTLILGGSFTVESLGLSPVQLLVIQTDGSYEALDSLKATFDGAVATGKTVFDSPVSALEDAYLVASRLDRANYLSEECLRCDLVRVCGGGYVPHRYHPDHGFLAPSIYCKDLDYLIRHIARALEEAGTAKRDVIAMSLQPIKEVEQAAP